jgi:hypothetical protein
MSIGCMHTQYPPYCLSQPLRDLLEVPSPEHHNTTKRPVTVKDILQSAIHCFHAIPMLHGNFIPNNCNSLLEKLWFKVILRYIAMGSILHIQWDIWQECDVWPSGRRIDAMSEDPTHRTIWP